MEIILALIVAFALFVLSQYNTEPKKVSNDKKETDVSLLSKSFAKWKTLVDGNLLSIIGWCMYGTIFLHLLYRFAFAYLPNESLAIVKTIPPFAAIEFIVFVIGSVILYRMYREKHPKKEAVQVDKKEIKVSSAPPKEPTILGDWKTWIILVLGYVLWGIGEQMHVLDGGIFLGGVMMLPEGMLYLPLTGIFYAILLGTFVVLTMCSVAPTIRALGFAFGIICFIASLVNFWFAPHSVANMAYIPAMRFLGGEGILFPADPIVPWQWIAAGFGTLYVLVKSCVKKASEGDFLGVVLVIITFAIFFPQLSHL